MHVFKRGAVYWFEFVLDGKRYRESTRLKNQRKAQDYGEAFRTALIQGEVGILERRPAPAFGAAMKSFLTWSKEHHQATISTSERYRYSSIPLLAFFKDSFLDRISPEDVERYKTTRASEKSPRTGRRVRPATVNRELACLRAMYNHVMKGNEALRNPVSRIKFLAENNQQERVLTYQEQERYLAAATPQLAAVAGLILETGMRPEEVYTLTVTQVFLSDSFLKVQKGKTPSARRRIELNPEAAEILRRRVEAAKAAGTTLLFPSENDGSRPITGVQSAHNRALRTSKVDQFRLYDLRHTWATRAAESGIDLVTLAAMLGHSKLNMVMRYAHPTQHHRIAAMEKLAQHNADRRRGEALADTPQNERKLRLV